MRCSVAHYIDEFLDIRPRMCSQVSRRGLEAVGDVINEPCILDVCNNLLQPIPSPFPAVERNDVCRLLTGIENCSSLEHVATQWRTGIVHEQSKHSHRIHMLAMHLDIVNGGGVVEDGMAENECCAIAAGWHWRL